MEIVNVVNKTIQWSPFPIGLSVEIRHGAVAGRAARQSACLSVMHSEGGAV